MKRNAVPEELLRQTGRREFYPHPGPPDRVSLSPGKRRGRTRVAEATFTSALSSGDETNDIVRARLLWPRTSGSGRLVVFLNGLGLARLSHWDSFLGPLARGGHAVLSVCLPYTCERTPAWTRPGGPYMSIDGDLALPAYEQAVSDVRGALDWALSESPFAQLGAGEPPAIMGVSLGALISVIAAAVEPRLGALVTVLGGADLDIIVFKGSYGTRVPEELRTAGIGIDARRRARLRYQAYIEKVREAAHPFDVEPDFHFFMFDPLTFAHHLRERPALMINALFDPIIPRESALQLWRELGSPEIVWLRGTHWPGGPWKPFVSRAVLRFLRSERSRSPRIPGDTTANVWIP